MVVMTTTTSMTTVQPCEPADLDTLTRRFQTWRATRARGQRIPAELWQAAIAVARVHGINPTVAALKLNYYDLQRRLPSGPTRQGGRAPPPVFVELPAGSLSGGGEERGLAELVHAGGTRLILHRGGTGSAELLAVVKLFLQHGR